MHGLYSWTWRLCSRFGGTNHFIKSFITSPSSSPLNLNQRQHLLTLAIETSCDDTGVAILEKYRAPASHHQPDDEFNNGGRPTTTKLGQAATLHFNRKHTADNSKFRGIHPVQSMLSHQEHLAALIVSALPSLPNALALPPPSSNTTAVEYEEAEEGEDDCPGPKKIIPIRCSKTGRWIWKRKPDFISVTRGPGMISSLDVGLNTAKGLALAWQIPLLGVNHMQAHALTPRLVAALDHEQQNSFSAPSCPKFPFLSLLVSGGHTLLLHSKSIIDHVILASTCDIAIGDALDKIARVVCPDFLLQSPGEIMYGRLLEQFAFPNGIGDHEYVPPATRGEELASNVTQWGWNLPVPFALTSSGSKTRLMKFSFTGLDSKVRKICAERGDIMAHEERLELAKEAMRVAFEHLASRVVLALDALRSNSDVIDTLVVSGGVASNSYLKTILSAFLAARNHSHISLSTPPPTLCTDNAAMIAWTGMEMYEAGWESELGCVGLRKWSLDANAEDGGVLGVGGWILRKLGGPPDLREEKPK